MAAHLNFLKGYVGRHPYLLPVSFQSLLKPVVVQFATWRELLLAIIQKLHDFHILLEAAISKPCRVHDEWVFDFFQVSLEQLKILDVFLFRLR